MSESIIVTPHRDFTHVTTTGKEGTIVRQANNIIWVNFGEREFAWNSYLVERDPDGESETSLSLQVSGCGTGECDGKYQWTGEWLEMKGYVTKDEGICMDVKRCEKYFVESVLGWQEISLCKTDCVRSLRALLRAYEASVKWDEVCERRSELRWERGYCPLHFMCELPFHYHISLICPRGKERPSVLQPSQRRVILFCIYFEIGR